ncbi:MAG: hypothetical protein ACP5O7_11530, partial [Phycisphaerae bacterium]
DDVVEVPRELKEKHKELPYYMDILYVNGDRLAPQHHAQHFKSNRKRYIVVVGRKIVGIGSTSTVNTYCPFESFSK